MPSTSRSMSGSVRILALLAVFRMTIAADYTPVGCYTSSTPLSNQGYQTYQSYGTCYTTCTNMGAAVMALTGANTCYCGNELPAASSKTSDSKCNLPCQGFPSNICGGDGAWSVLTTGLKANVPSYGGSGDSGSGSSISSSSSSIASSPSPTSTPVATPSTTMATNTRKAGGGGGGKTVITSVGGATTIVVTQSPASASTSPESQQSNSGGGTNVGAIAGGVVVGVLAVAGIIAGVYFYLRHRRNQEAEDEYKRTQVSDFMRGGERKPPGTGYSQMSDSRLDPEAGARRNSHGSIADDQDYSRRILRVANPDRS